MATAKLQNTTASSKRKKDAARAVPDDEVFLQPWFVPKKIFLTIRSLLPHCQLMKYQYYFDDYGCLKCEKPGQLYGSNGLCHHCNQIVRKRLIFSLTRRFRRIGTPVDSAVIHAYLGQPRPRKRHRETHKPRKHCRFC
jgi:hypothetical protein